MDTKFKKPKGFGEILDQTFSLSKKNFADFMLIFLILMGPIYLLEAMVQLLSGVSFFREVGSGGSWYEQILSSFNEPEMYAANVGLELGLAFIGFISIILLPIAWAAILFAIHHISKNEEYTIGSVLRGAFSRFWPILGSSILYCFIVFALVIIPIIIVTFTGAIGTIINPIAGIILAILLFLAFAIGIGYLLTRLSFYFGSVVLDRESPGFSRSWSLTRKRTWVLFGLYIVFSLIVTCISVALEFSFGIFLGNSVLLTLIINAASLFTSMIFAVGYAVMYLDLKTRHDADDLREMIEDYNVIQ